VWVAGGGIGARSVIQACAQRSFPSASAAADALVAVAGAVDAGVTEAATAICPGARRLVADRAEAVEATLGVVGTLAEHAVARQCADLDVLEAGVAILGPARAAPGRSRPALAGAGIVAAALVALVACLVIIGATR
jgi:hypothetical protein